MITSAPPTELASTRTSGHAPAAADVADLGDLVTQVTSDPAVVALTGVAMPLMHRAHYGVMVDHSDRLEAAAAAAQLADVVPIGFYQQPANFYRTKSGSKLHCAGHCGHSTVVVRVPSEVDHAQLCSNCQDSFPAPHGVWSSLDRLRDTVELAVEFSDVVGQQGADSAEALRAMRKLRASADLLHTERDELPDAVSEVAELLLAAANLADRIVPRSREQQVTMVTKVLRDLAVPPRVDVDPYLVTLLDPVLTSLWHRYRRGELPDGPIDWSRQMLSESVWEMLRRSHMSESLLDEVERVRQRWQHAIAEMAVATVDSPCDAVMLLDRASVEVVHDLTELWPSRTLQAGAVLLAVPTLLVPTLLAATWRARSWVVARQLPNPVTIDLLDTLAVLAADGCAPEDMRDLLPAAEQALAS